MDLTPGPAEDQERSDGLDLGEELYQAAERAMSSAFRRYTGTKPGEHMWNLDMEATWRVVAKSVTDLAYQSGREDAAKAIEAERDRWESLGYDDGGAWVAAVRLARGQHTQDGGTEQ